MAEPVFSLTDLSSPDVAGLATYHGHSHPAHAFPSTRSTTQHPRTCGPGPRQWSRTSSLSHPASWSASARIGIAAKSRDSYI